MYVAGGGGGEFHQLRRQPASVRLGLDLPDYIPLPSTDVRAAISCCDVLSTTSAQNADEPHVADTEDRARVTSTTDDLRAQTTEDRATTALNSEIVRQLRLIVARLDAAGSHSECETVAAEWRRAAVIIDRCLFRVFLATTVISSLVVLVIVPLCSQSTH